MPRPRNSVGLSCWKWLEAFPPITVRLAARGGAGRAVVALSHQEIAIETGIPLARIIEISESFDWRGVTISEAEAFCRACNFDPTNAADRKRQRDYIRICQKKTPGRAPHFLTSSPWWRSQFLPLIDLLRSRPTSSTESESSALPEKKYAA